jgi:hypothetical protein
MRSPLIITAQLLHPLRSGRRSPFSRSRPPPPPVIALSTTTTTRPCWALLPDHKHCKHGHTEDCPDSDNCELVD